MFLLHQYFSMKNYNRVSHIAYRTSLIEIIPDAMCDVRYAMREKGSCNMIIC